LKRLRRVAGTPEFRKTLAVIGMELKRELLTLTPGALAPSGN